MALTYQEELTCRGILAEHNFKMVSIEDEVVSAANGTLVRYVDGVDESVQDICREFLQTLISANNASVAVISGTLTPYDVTGEYFDTHESQNGYPIRQTADDDYTLKVEVDGANYHWEISNEWDEVLYASNAAAGAPPSLNDAVWTAAGKVYVNLVDSRVMEDSFLTDEDGPYYTTAGTATSVLDTPSVGTYATVVDPLADQKVRGGTYRGGKVWCEREGQTDKWAVYQTLHILNEAHTYILSGKSVEKYTTDETRLYERIPEADVNTMINSLTVLGSYALVSSSVQQTRAPGIYDIRLTLRTMSGAEGDIQLGDTGGLFTQTLWVRRRVAEADLADQITAIKTNSLARNVRASGTRQEGYYDIFYTLIVVPASRIERQVSYDRRQNAWATAEYNEVLAKQRYIESVDAKGKETFGYLDYLLRKPREYIGGLSNQARKVEIATTISYSESNPGILLGMFLGITSTGGQSRQLPNGLWEKRVVVEKIPWW